MAKDNLAKIEGMLLISAHHDVRGLKHWIEELQKRKIPAIVQVEPNFLDKNCTFIKELTHKGFEVSGLWDEEPLWNKTYDYQYDKMRLTKDRVQSCTGKPMRIFNSKYFAYDETTLKVADKLGIEYIFARGTAGARAVVHKPVEYKTKIISVSNVPSKSMGTGSLCDISLWSRSETPDDFRRILLDLKEDKIVLVSHTTLGGVKQNWWQVYEDFLNTGRVIWKSIDEFSAEVVTLPVSQIPRNIQVQYVKTNPKIPLEQEPDYPGLDIVAGNTRAADEEQQESGSCI